MFTAIIQARLGSTRLPGKVIKTILGKTVLELLVERVLRSAYVKKAVIATTVEKKDDAISDFCEQRGILCFRGSENDVLERHYQAAKEFGAHDIIRITSDCPLVDMELVDAMIGLFKRNRENCDIVTNISPPSFPDGLDAYVFPFTTLEKAQNEAKTPFEREHVTPYILEHPEKFRVINVPNPQGDMSQTHRWTLDFPEDFQFIKSIYENLYPENK